MSTESTHFQRTRSRPAIAFTARGQGETVLFMHGIGGNRRNWDGQLRHFETQYRCTSMDFRGYGDSDDIDGHFDLVDLASDALAVLDEVGVERAHVVGLSLGGLVAQALYARAPQRVRSLSLVACRSAAEPIMPAARREAFMRERLEPLRNGGPEMLAQSLVGSLVGGSATPTAREQVMGSLRMIRPDSYFRVMEARMRVSPFLNPCDVGVPTFVVAGTEDQVAPESQMRELAAQIPGAELAVIHGAGHLINIEKPDEFNAGLQAFLHRVAGNTQGLGVERCA